MIYSLAGKLIFKKPNLVVVEAAGIGFKILVSSGTSRRLPKAGSRIKLFCFTCLNREGIDLYGFLTEKELGVFETFISINGVGPKAALKVLGTMSIERLLSAVEHGRTDLLTRAAGVGRKKAARIIFEMQGRFKEEKSKELVSLLEANAELAAVLKELGYKQKEIQAVIQKIPDKAQKIEEKLRAALKLLSRS